MSRSKLPICIAVVNTAFALWLLYDCFLAHIFHRYSVYSHDQHQQEQPTNIALFQHPHPREGFVKFATLSVLRGGIFYNYYPLDWSLLVPAFETRLNLIIYIWQAGPVLRRLGDCLLGTNDGRYSGDGQGWKHKPQLRRGRRRSRVGGMDESETKK